MLCMSVDELEFRGCKEFKSKEGESFTKYFFDDPSGERYEFFGRNVEGIENLNKGETYTVVLNIGSKTGKAALYGLQK